MIRKYLTSLIKILILPLVLVSGLYNVYAQTDTQGNADLIANRYVISDVNVSDLKTKIDGNNVTGSFSIESKEGSVSNVVYGILTEVNGQLVETKELGYIKLIRENELILKDFSYTIPSYLKGDSTSTLLVTTSEGLLLGRRIINSSTLQGAGDNFSCKHTSLSATSSVECQTKTSNPLNVSHYSIFFGGFLNNKNYTPVNGKVVIPNEDSVPGRGYVEVKDSVTGETHILPTFMNSEFASIQGVMIDSNAGSIFVHVTARFNKVISPQVSVILKNGQTICGKGAVTAMGLVSVIDIPTTCASGVAEVVFKDKDQTLDTFVTTFDTSAYVPSYNSPKNIITNKIISLVVVIIALAIIAGFIYLYQAKKIRLTVRGSKLTVVALFLGFSYLVMPLKSEALSFSGYEMACFPMTQSFCGTEQAWACDASINTDQSSYTPGSSVTLSGYGYLSYDIAARGSGSCSIGGISGSTSASGGNGGANFSGSASGGTASLPAGTKSIAITFTYGGGTTGSVQPGAGTRQTGTLYYTVSGATPSVNINFSSIFDKTKIFSTNLLKMSVDHAMAGIVK